jgi:hypothetical protein
MRNVVQHVEAHDRAQLFLGRGPAGERMLEAARKIVHRPLEQVEQDLLDGK